MDDKSRPSPVVLPRPTGDIIIRQFQPKDAAQVHALLVEGLVYGRECRELLSSNYFIKLHFNAADSPHNVAQRRNLTGPISCVAYLSFALGLGCLFRRNLVLQIGGAALSLGATALFVYMRRTITGLFVHYCAVARETDMADIPQSYEVPLSIEGIESPQTQGPAGFWVAAIESPNQKTSEVVGYLGLGGSLSKC
jgi:hypothetical protein